MRPPLLIGIFYPRPNDRRLLLYLLRSYTFSWAGIELRDQPLNHGAKIDGRKDRNIDVKKSIHYYLALGNFFHRPLVRFVLVGSTKRTKQDISRNAAYPSYPVPTNPGLLYSGNPFPACHSPITNKNRWAYAAQVRQFH
jgi:hypothetical protein